MPELKDQKDRDEQTRTNTVVLEDYLQSDRFADHLRQILPSHLDSDRFSTIAFRQLGSVPDLKRCTLQSVAGGIMQAATLGLEIATQGESWLIPRQIYDKDKGEKVWEASLQVGYLGHLALAWRSGQIAAIQTDVVIEGDVFDFQRGTSGYLHHKPRKGRDQSDFDRIEYAYAIAKTVLGGEVWMCLDRTEIERLRSSGPSGNSPAWKAWYDQMAMGKALKRTLKFCPKSRELSRAITLDDQTDANVRQDFAMDLPALPAEVTGKSAVGEDMLRRAGQGGRERRRAADPPPPGDSQEPEPAPIEKPTPPATQEVKLGGSRKGSMGF